MALSKGGGGGGGKLEDTIIRYVAARSSGNTAATRLNDTSAASGNALSNASAYAGNSLSGASAYAGGALNNASRGYENDVIAFQQKVADRKPAQTQPTVKEYMQERNGGSQPGLKAAGYYQVPLPANATGTAVRSAESKYGGDVYGPTQSRGYESDVMAFQQNIADRQAIPQWQSPGWGAASQTQATAQGAPAQSQAQKPAFDPMKVAVGNNVDNNAIMAQRAQENAQNSWNPLTPRVAIDGPRPWGGTNDVNAMTFAKRSGGMEQQYRLHRRIQEEIYMRNGQPAMRQYPRPITDRVSSGTASSVARKQGDK